MLGNKTQVHIQEILEPLLKNVFFYRQKYNVNDEQYLPDLTPTLCCNEILNPDSKFIQCKSCKELYHFDCIAKVSSQKCLKPGCNNTFDSSLSNINSSTVSNISSNVQTEKFLNVKRPRANETIDITMNEESVLEHSRVKENEDRKEDNKYPNLSEEARKYLVNLTENIEKRNQAKFSNMGADDKSRNTVREKILCSLVINLNYFKFSCMELKKQKKTTMNLQN